MKVFQYVSPDKSLELIWQVETGKLTLNVEHGGVSIVLPDDARISLSKALWYSVRTEDRKCGDGS